MGAKANRRRVVSSDDDYRDFIRDSARVLDVSTELHDVVPALMDSPFSATAQSRVVALLTSERQEAANEAADRISRLANEDPEVA